jgi:hypothetical protein
VAGDCCHDYQRVCADAPRGKTDATLPVAPAGPSVDTGGAGDGGVTGSCRASCGLAAAVQNGQAGSGSTCYCDDQCAITLDCCSDYTDVCGDQPGDGSSGGSEGGSKGSNTSPVACKDANQDCMQWKGYGYCSQTSTNHAFMQKVCPITCGFQTCGKGGDMPSTTQVRKPTPGTTRATTAEPEPQCTCTSCCSWMAVLASDPLMMAQPERACTPALVELHKPMCPFRQADLVLLIDTSGSLDSHVATTTTLAAAIAARLQIGACMRPLLV